MKTTCGIIFVLLATSLVSETRAAPQVVATSPLRQKINAPANTDIQVVFNEAIDPASINGVSFRVFGRWSGPATGTIDVASNTVTFTPSVPFFAGEYVTVSMSKGIENTLGEPMAFGYAWSFWIKSGPGTLDLEYVTRYNARDGVAWAQIYGAYAGDINNDGWSDLFAPCEQTDDMRIWMNNGAGLYPGGFTIEKPANMNAPSPNEGADFNNDGEIDVVVGSHGNNRLVVMFGDGTGDFPTNVPLIASGNAVYGDGVLDLNGDGWDDVVAAARVGDKTSIFLNNGNGTFAAKVDIEAGVLNETSIAVADANNDGIMDVFLGNYGAPRHITVLLGNGTGGLVAQTPVPTYGRPWMLAAGDLNGDGNVDVFSAAADGNGIGIHFGNGAGGLSAATSLTTGQYPLAIDAGDLDGDGDLDLVSSDYNWASWTLWENTGNGTFINQRTLDASAAGSCATLHDRDNDGDLDMTGVDEIDDWVYLFENNPPPTHVDPVRATASMAQNQPNPFNPATTIHFELGHAGTVDLSVYDAAGAHVKTLARGQRNAGKHDTRWDGTDSNGQRVASGVYFYRLTANGEELTRKMMLLK
jgi:hypothetical protein